MIYSDGVTEAVSPTGEEFGATRLYEVVSRNIEASAAGIRDRIESSLTKFAQGTSAADDITLVISHKTVIKEIGNPDHGPDTDMERFTSSRSPITLQS